MRRILLAGAIATALAVLIAGFAIPALAHGGSEGSGTETLSPEDWEAMHEACLNSDWEGMLEEMEQFHEQYFTGMPCFGTANTGTDGGGQTPGPGWDGMMGEGWDSHMGDGYGGMMGEGGYGHMGGGYGGGYGGHMGGGMMGW